MNIQDSSLYKKPNNDCRLQDLLSVDGRRNSAYFEDIHGIISREMQDCQINCVQNNTATHEVSVHPSAFYFCLFCSLLYKFPGYWISRYLFGGGDHVIWSGLRNEYWTQNYIMYDFTICKKSKDLSFHVILCDIYKFLVSLWTDVTKFWHFNRLWTISSMQGQIRTSHLRWWVPRLVMFWRWGCGT